MGVEQDRRNPLPEGTLAVGVGLLIAGRHRLRLPRAGGPRARARSEYAPLGAAVDGRLPGRARVLPPGRAGGQPGAGRTPGAGRRRRARSCARPRSSPAVVLGSCSCSSRCRPRRSDAEALRRRAAARSSASPWRSPAPPPATSPGAPAAGRAASGPTPSSSPPTASCGCCCASALAAAGVDSPGWYGVAVGLAPARRRRCIAVGPRAGPRRRRAPAPAGASCHRALGDRCSSASVLSFTLVNAGPLAVDLARHEVRAGRRRPVPQRPDHRPGPAVPLPGRAGVAAAQAVGAGRRRALRRAPGRAAQPARRHRRHRRRSPRSAPSSSGPRSSTSLFGPSSSSTTARSACSPCRAPLYMLALALGPGGHRPVRAPARGGVAGASASPRSCS